MWLVPQYLLQACGILLLIAGGRHYRLGQFVGISQLRGASSGGSATGGGIDSSGVLGLVRHPWYTAVVLLLWARDLDMAALVGNGVLTVYIVVGTLLEERKFVHEFGDAYCGYQGRVSMFLPLKWIREGGSLPEGFWRSRAVELCSSATPFLNEAKCIWVW